MPNCSRGWADRCASSTGKTCRCACGGQNHGLRAVARVTARDRGARWDVLSCPPELTHIYPVLVIRDVGPWDKHLTVTNDAENVVAALILQGHLQPGMRLFYYDSEGALDEITWTVAKGFTGFAPGFRGEAAHV